MLAPYFISFHSPKKKKYGNLKSSLFFLLNFQFYRQCMFVQKAFLFDRKFSTPDTSVGTFSEQVICTLYKCTSFIKAYVEKTQFKWTKKCKAIFVLSLTNNHRIIAISSEDCMPYLFLALLMQNCSHAHCAKLGVSLD